MYFKRLEIFGFKSFADKTTLNFEQGITAVIGPNGCGKSNVFDAIRWVLGEQSVKELRGSSMEDVIFNGTDKKPALGFAEVSLTFSNEKRMLPVEYDEVTITRRLFRSGESEYLINKTPVRLRDINEMIMGTGIGAEAYSLVQQGKVDLVVNAKPEERRLILDEASGITKYKAKKREALNKLMATETNLLRINDIVTEVKRQISSLERQASKARRYKEEFEKLKGLEVKFANYLLANSAGRREEMRRELESLRRREAELLEEVREFQDLVEHETQVIEELEDKINEAKGEDIKIDGRIDLNNRQIGFNEERIAGIEQSEAKGSETKRQLEERCQEQRGKIEELQVILDGIDKTHQENISRLQARKSALEEIIRAIEEAKQGIRAEESAILTINSRQVQVKNQMTDVMKEVQGALARQRRLEHENQKVVQEKTDADEKYDSFCRRIETAAADLEKAREELLADTGKLNDLTGRLESVAQQIDGLEKKRILLESQKEFIEKLAVQYKDIPDPVVEGRLITDAPPLDHHTGIIGKVKEVRKTAQGGWLPSSGKEQYEILCETKFIELDPKQIRGQIEELTVRIDGELQIKAGIVEAANRQKDRIEELKKNLHEREKNLSILTAQRQDIEADVRKVAEELEVLASERQEVDENVVRMKEREDSLSAELNTLNQALQDSQIKIRDFQQGISEKIQEKEEISVVIAQLESEVSSVGEKRRSHQENLQMFQAALEGQEQELSRLDEDTREQEKRREQYREEIALLEEKTVELRTQKEGLRASLSEYERQKNEMEQRIKSVQANVGSYHTEINEIKEKLHRQQLSEQEIGFKDKEIYDRLLQSYKIDLNEYNRMSAAAASQPEEGPAAAVPEPPLDPEELRISIDRLRKRCDSFGTVNLVAIEEFDELRERFEFLTKQQSDLIESKEALRQTINKINRQTRQMFMDTFTKVCEEFRIYFRMLFGGGEADLILLDPENVLECGIEIVARPPGKKLQNVSLLSGGEKTLTAIALIFGVFKVNPSPFCVLDEIDAALDESNVGRFSYLLKDFAKIAQFIVITHNKKTIASSDVLYGITMQETGVSKVVSVKFGDEKEEAPEEITAGV